MISIIISYIFLGISLSAPVGPINIAQFNKGIHHGFLNAWLVGIGGMLADVLFMFIIYYGLADYLTTPIPKLLMWTLGCLVLIYLGYESIRDSKKKITLAESNQYEPPIKSFVTGFLLAVSNPLNIIFWIGIYGSVLTEAVHTIGKQQALLYSGAIFIGIMIWDVSMAAIAHFSRKRINNTIIKWISIIAGIVLWIFGLNFGYQAIITFMDIY
ncbi:LysE family transporter [Gracilibacillus thailandensis]|uniref:Lysine transporter LysE n=1 Tax=Gracilibacillus thailandensis TaxID=563735 RepID=A0A6N7R1K1_9BACI|nr:LysE family transporter [Gracilibacillus thailandensis]MRI67110.1 lysine transporter LysE [Gracilibacillus thailandensis]